MNIICSHTKTIDGFKIYEPCLNWEHHYTIGMKNGRDSVSACEVEGHLEIVSIYYNGRNYTADRFLKQYRENEEIQNVLKELEKDLI